MFHKRNFLSLTRCLGNFSSLARLGSVIFGQNPLRLYASGKCGKKPPDTCGKVVTPCETPEKVDKPIKADPKAKFVSMWHMKDCEAKLCEMDLRYDMKYYSISDKRKRRYQVTWNECPRLLIKPKKVCIYEKMKRPKIKRRKRSAAGGATAGKTCGPKPKKGACIYIVAPCCKTGRRPPKCASAYPSLGNCEKKKTPYPSFSECKKDPLTTAPPTECKCLDIPAICDAWAYFRRRLAIGKSGPKKCGEA